MNSAPSIASSNPAVPPEFNIRCFDLDALAIDTGLLSGAESERVARKRTALLQQRQAASFQCVRVTLGDVLGVDPRTLRIAIGGSGKPYLEGRALAFNMSHSGRVGLLAWGPRELGVDVEAMIARPTPALAATILTAIEFEAWHRLDEPSRQAWLTRAWTRKEAVLKAVGSGLRMAPAEVEVGGGAGEGGAWELVLDGFRLSGHDVLSTVPVGYRAAVCVVAERG